MWFRAVRACRICQIVWQFPAIGFSDLSAAKACSFSTALLGASRIFVESSAPNMAGEHKVVGVRRRHDRIHCGLPYRLLLACSDSAVLTVAVTSEPVRLSYFWMPVRGSKGFVIHQMCVCVCFQVCVSLGRAAAYDQCTLAVLTLKARSSR